MPCQAPQVGATCQLWQPAVEVQALPSVLRSQYNLRSYLARMYFSTTGRSDTLGKRRKPILKAKF